MPKKPLKKQENQAICSPHKGMCFCKLLLAILIIVLVWVSAATWSKVIITIAAALIILCAHCPCHKMKN